MPAEETVKPNPSSPQPGKELPDAAAPAGGISSGQQAAKSDSATTVGSLFENHKGKLAVGAAAMLGIAVFYKWRENKLAKDDPEEYARLRRLKAAVGTDETKARHKGKTE